MAGHQILYFRTLPLCIVLTLRWSRTKLGLYLHTWQFEKSRQLLSLESHLLCSLDFPTPVWVKIITWIRQDTQVSHKGQTFENYVFLNQDCWKQLKTHLPPTCIEHFLEFFKLVSVLPIWFPADRTNRFPNLRKVKNPISKHCTCQTQRICQTQEELLHQGTSAVGIVF